MYKKPNIQLKCPRCNSYIYGEGKERKCLNCGHVIDHVVKVKEFYDYNQEVIEYAFKTFGRQETERLARIPPGTMTGLLRRWKAARQDDLPLKTPRAPSGPTTPVPVADPSTSTPKLPPFPPFSNDWDPEVQRAWINTYGILKSINGGTSWIGNLSK